MPLWPGVAPLGLYIAGARNNFILWGRRCVRDRGFENQRYRASGLNLVVAAIVLWNTAYLERTVQALRASGKDVGDRLLPHLSPF